MDSNQRLILTVVLCVGIVLSFQLFAPKEAPAPPDQQPAAEKAPPAPGPPSGPAPTAPAPGALPVPSAPTAALPAGPEPKVTLETDNLVLGFGTRDGALLEARLKGEKGHRQNSQEPVDLAAGLEEQPERLFSLRLGGGLPSPGPCSLAGQTATSVSFRCQGQGLTLAKGYVVEGPNRLRLAASVTNLTQAPLSGEVALVAPAVVNPAQQHRGGCALTSCSMLSAPAQPTYVMCRHDDKVTRAVFDADKKTQPLEGSSRFGGVEESYFAAVAVPLQDASCELDTPAPELSQALLSTSLRTIAPGQTAEVSFALVLGPKDTRFLAAESAAIASATKISDPGLEKVVDLGFFGAIARVLLELLRLFHGLLPNWGVAIILLTIFVKVLTFPLAWKAMKSMEEVRKLAPEMEAIKKKYPEDREKQQLETMQLYQKHKVNPLGGCLPMLIQMPIWLALYTVLQRSVELYNEPFIGGWIGDLTSRDPYYVLPLAMGATMFITQRMQPTQMDATQQKMMLYFMPGFFTLIMLQLPAGLTLYIFINNLLSIAQQLLLRRSMGQPMIGAPVVAAAHAGGAVTALPQKKTRRKDGP